MPAKTEAQRRAACAEMGRRKKGQKGGKKKPFGEAKTKDVRDYCKMAKVH